MIKLVTFNAAGFGKKAGILLLSFILFIFLIYYCVHDIQKSITSIEIFSLQYSGKVVINDRKVVKQIYEVIQSSSKSADYQKQVQTQKQKTEQKFQYKLVLHATGQQQIFFFREEPHLYEQSAGTMIHLSDGGKCLAPWIEKIKKLNPYGEFVAWNQAKNIFKKYDKAKVTDFETKQSFWVQRRAGSLHADVQPLTAKDSAVMKNIYSGKWSWKRRAVIVEAGGRRLAASMNGMPHGAGAISGNDFNGHFCIHFRDSKLHSNRDDLAHQIMTWKAAGVAEEMLSKETPQRIMEVTLKYLEQGDYPTAAQLMGISEKSSLYKQLGSIDWLVVSKYDKPTQEGERNIFKVYFSYKIHKGRTFNNKPVTIHLIKGAGPIPWKIEPEFVEGLFLDEKPV